MSCINPSLLAQPSSETQVSLTALQPPKSILSALGNEPPGISASSMQAIPPTYTARRRFTGQRRRFFRRQQESLAPGVLIRPAARTAQPPQIEL
jgi:hypothetical protein